MIGKEEHREIFPGVTNMSIKFVMPKAGLTMIEGTIAEWLVEEGQEIKKGEAAFSYENEKTTIDCEAPESGFIHMVANVGDVVKVGEAVAYIAESKEEYQKLLASSVETHDLSSTEGTATAEIHDGIKFVMPKAGLTMIEGTIAEWLVEEGQEIKKGEAAFSYENEKTTIDCEAPENGFIHIVANVGDVVKVGEPVAYIAKNKEEYEKMLATGSVDKKKEAMCANECSPCARKVAENHAAKIMEDMIVKEKSESKRVKSSGLARNIAKNKGVDINLIKGTGPNGRVVAKDVHAYLEQQTVIQSESKAPVVPISTGEVVRTTMTPARKAIASNLRYSIDTMVQASSNTEFDVTELFALREKLVEQQEYLGWKITINDLLVMATVKVLEKHPLLNATFDGEVLTSYPNVNINIAVGAEAGLAIPVVRDADKMTLLELSKALKDIAVRAREGKIRPGEQSGGYFTVSNVGMYPIDFGSPIANAPQVGLFAFGRPRDRLARINGEICDRKMMHVMFIFDHRVFDGLEQGKIMKDLQMYLEHPELMLV